MLVRKIRSDPLMIHYKAAFVNSSVTQTETALVHSIDHIASLISYALHEAEECDHHVQFSFKKNGI